MRTRFSSVGPWNGAAARLRPSGEKASARISVVSENPFSSRAGPPATGTTKTRPWDPETAAYSPEARERFAELAGELRRLRQHAGDPLLDLVRRIIDTSGLDVELASSVSRPWPAVRNR